MRTKSKVVFSLLTTSLASAMSLPAVAASPTPPPGQEISGKSPALCSVGDAPEPGIQGEVPAGQAPDYNCGVKLIGHLPIVGNVAGTGRCVYVRSGGQGGAPGPTTISVIDVSNPRKPVVVGNPLPLYLRSETLRVVVTKDRAVMVSGGSVFDISDCLHPRLAGEIKWPDTTVPGVRTRNLPHDIRINREGTKVFAAFGVWEADISDLNAPDSWKITDHRCEVAAQLPGPWQEVHRAAIKAGRSLCDDAMKPAPAGSNYSMGASPYQISLLWPQVSHSPDFNADDTRLYVGDQAGGNSALWAPVPKVRIIDITQHPFKVLGEVDGAGHGLDWFRSGGRDYVIHSNEGTSAIPGRPHDGDSCSNFPRPFSLGWAYEAYIADVTDPAQAKNVSMVQLAINEPQFCQIRKSSGRDPWIAYHLLDNPINPKFTAVNFGDAGLRIFDIRDPLKPKEVAYFNHGAPVHAQVGYYDAARKLIYFSDTGGFNVLQIEPRVVTKLGL